MAPTTGRIVHYKLSMTDALRIKNQRDNEVSKRIHASNEARENDVVPLLIVRVWPDEYGPGIPGVNGQAFLDGNDSYWVTSAAEGDKAGQWAWPPRT